MRGLAPALLLLLAGCDSGGVGENNVSANQIERLSTPEVEPTTDPQASARLEAIGPAEITSEGLGGPGCAFSVGGETLLAATAEDAIARVGGTLVHFAHSAPVGPSGGFFEDRRISISVGRTDADLLPGAAGWPARMTVTNRRTGARVDQEGLWRCGA